MNILLMKNRNMKKLWDFLIYITNNEKKSRHEEIFDVVFFLVNTAASIFGVVMFILYNEPQWIPVLVVEYTWALDNMRHNRP